MSDDSLANRKVYSGHVFHHQRPGWKDLNRVSEASMGLHFKMVFSEHLSKPTHARRKAAFQRE